ncbi:uncharacterized protein LOC120817395 isoform X5 [Gasterosteus aculeatus]
MQPGRYTRVREVLQEKISETGAIQILPARPVFFTESPRARSVFCARGEQSLASGPEMERHRYLTFNQKSVLLHGILQLAAAGLCVVCGFIDAVFRNDTPLSASRTPVWGGLVMAAPGVLAMFASQRKNSILVSVMVVAAGLSCVAAAFVSGYACLTLTYGEEDREVFHQHDSPQVTFVLHRMVKGANATILLTCTICLALSSVIAFVGCRGLPCCGCYDARTGLETLVPQCDPENTEMVWTWQADDNRLFNCPPQSIDQSIREEEEGPSKLPPYSRLT